MKEQPCLPSRAAHHWVIDSPVSGVQFVMGKCKYCKRTQSWNKLAGEQTAFEAANDWRDKAKKQ